MSIYLDNAATTQVCPEAIAAAAQAMGECYGNPSSTHKMGRDAKRLLDSARSTVAKAMGCRPEELYFTSCGSESDNWAIIRAAEYHRRGKHIISSTAEHQAVLKSMAYLEKQGFEVSYLDPMPDGSIHVEQVMQTLRPDTALVSLMMVNNETGAITDIAAIAAAMKKAGSKAYLHTDAVQAFLKVPFSAKSLGADLISISGHKIHAPKGVGALYIRQGLPLPPYLLGGSQEQGRRAGTEAIPQIAAFAAAVQAAWPQQREHAAAMAQLRDHAIRRLTNENEGLTVLGGGAPHILSVSLPGYRSEVLMNYLEGREIYVSKSSACKKGGRSHVLEAMGLKSDVIDGAIRVSFSRMNTREDVDAFCDALAKAREELRAALRR